MVKPEKFGHLHLHYHFTVLLKETNFNEFKLTLTKARRPDQCV